MEDHVSGEWRRLFDGLVGPAASAAAEALLRPEPEDVIVVAPGFDLPDERADGVDRGFIPDSADQVAVRAFLSPHAQRLARQLAGHPDATAVTGAVEVPVGRPGVAEQQPVLVVAQAIAAPDRPLARAVLTLPAYFAVSAKLQPVRQELLSLVAVTDLVFESRRAISGQPQVILRLTALKGDGSPARVARMTRDPRQAARVAEAIKRALDGSPAFDEGFTAWLSGTEPWDEARLDPERRELLAQAESTANSSRLRDLAEVRAGRAAARGDGDLEPVLTPGEISEPLPPVNQLGVRPLPPGAVRLTPGDIVGRDLRPLAWAIVTDDLRGVGAGNGLLVVRPRHSELGPFLCAYLNSPTANTLLAPTGTIPRISRGDLAELPVPAPPLETLQTLNQQGAGIRDVIVRARTVADDLSAAYADAFASMDSAEVVSRLSEVAERATVVDQTLTRQEQPQRSYQDVYPHPIARALRQANIVGDALLRYDAAIRAAETLIITLGAVSAAWAAHAATPVPNARQWADALRGSGPSIGHWVSVTRAVGEAARRSDQPALGLAAATASRRGNRGLTHDLDRLVTARNAHRHGRGPRTAGAASDQLAELEDVLSSALAGSALLSEVRWVMADRVDWDRRLNDHQVQALSLMGDHPDFERVTFRLTHPIQPRLVYMVTGSEVIPLDPFMSLHDCALCQHAELYYPETLTRDTAHLLSPNTPHTIASTHVAEDLHIALGHLGLTAASTT
jgi:hypothetical protein